MFDACQFSEKVALQQVEVLREQARGHRICVQKLKDGISLVANERDDALESFAKASGYGTHMDAMETMIRTMEMLVAKRVRESDEKNEAMRDWQRETEDR